MKKKPLLCVFAGANEGKNIKYKSETIKLAKCLSAYSFKFIYGGSSKGLMGSFSNEIIKNNGNITGVIPSFLIEKETPNKNLSKLKIVKSMHQRKKLMYKNANGFIALPGGLGTLDEIMEVLTWKQLQIITAPIFFLNINDYWRNLILLLEKIKKENFSHSNTIDHLIFEKEPYLLSKNIINMLYLN